MVVTGCQENKSCSEVLNFLERLDDRIRCTHEETVAVVNQSEAMFAELDEYSKNMLSEAFWTLNVPSSQFDECPKLSS